MRLFVGRATSFGAVEQVRHHGVQEGPQRTRDRRRARERRGAAGAGAAARHGRRGQRFGLESTGLEAAHQRLDLERHIDQAEYYKKRCEKAEAAMEKSKRQQNAYPTTTAYLFDFN